MKYYVISDIHGYYEATLKALQDAGFFTDNTEKKVILCGDLLDRGNDAVSLVEFLLDLKANNQLIYIKGNHEELLLRALYEIENGNAFEIASGRSHHYFNGTWDTLLQLSNMNDQDAVDHPLTLIQRVKASRFYQELFPFAIDYYETKHYIFCHGWIPTIIKGFQPNAEYQFDPDWRKAPPSMWEKARWLNGMALSCKYHINEPQKTIICGHWHASYGHALFENKGFEFGEYADFSPFYADGIIAIDACTVKSGMVNCIVLTEDEN